MGTRQPLFNVDHGVSAYEKVAAASIGAGRPAGQTSTEFALHALINCTVRTPEQLHSLLVEVARIANDFMFASPTTYDRIDEVVDMLDTASDIAEGLKERDATCTSCAGTGEGRSDYQSCGGCGGKGWRA